jgi:HAE1 family hydrophobic/amphiphilic exporter-1
VAAFMPMLIMTGSTGEFFALIPKAVSFAIAASLIECLFILPLHYLDWGPKADTDGKAPHEKDNAFMRLARRFTEWGMALTMRFKKLSLLAVFVAFAAAMFVLLVSVSGRMSLIKIRFFPEEYNEYYAILEGPASTPIEKTRAVVEDISNFILDDGEGFAKTATGFAGFYINEDYQNIYGGNLGIVIVTMPAKAKWAFDDPKAHLERMRERLEERFEKDGYDIRVNAEETGPPAGKDVNVRVLGQNMDSVYALAAELKRFMREDSSMGPHLADLKDDSGQPNRVLRFEVRQDRAQEYGFDQAAVAGLAASVLDGRYVGKYRVSDEELELKLMLSRSALNRPGDALTLPLMEHPSGPVRLGDLVRIETSREPGQLNRYNTERAVTLSANIKSGSQTSTTEIVNRIKKHYQAVRAEFPGAGLDFGGEFESTRRSFTSLAYAFGIAVLLIYLILATQFGSYVQPMIILSAVVFSLIGVVFGKLVTQSLFTVNSFIAVVGVTGVVVNDSLVLLDFINRAYRRGLNRAEAIREGIRLRLRPILLTTLTTTLGLLPMALGIPSYSMTWGTMASTFVTGLAAATTLTLFIVPIEWDMVMRFAEWRAGRKRAKMEDAAGSDDLKER